MLVHGYTIHNIAKKRYLGDLRVYKAQKHSPSLTTDTTLAFLVDTIIPPSMPRLRLWHVSNACSLAVHIVLLETGLPFELISLQIQKQPGDDGPAKLPDHFRAVNPKMRVPVLAIDDEIITELPAIQLQ